MFNKIYKLDFTRKKMFIKIKNFMAGQLIVKNF